MKSQRHILAQIERSLDDELSRDEAAELEAMMQGQPALRDHLDSVTELRGILRAKFDDAANHVDFAAMSGNVMSALEPAARQQDMEMLAMAWADGELHDESDVVAVQQYLRSQPDASAAVDGLSNLRDVARMPFERAQESVDFGALSERVMLEIDREDAAGVATVEPSGEKSSALSTILGWLRAPGTGVAAFAGAAVAIAVILPILLQSNSGEQATPQAPIVNNFYMTPPEVESVRYEEGYWGAVTQGDDMSAPVIWIQQDEPVDPSADDNGTETPDASTNDRGI